MPYVRTRGNQLLIVHGVRNKATRAVEQQILFTFYTKAEVLGATGSPHHQTSQKFKELLESEYPSIKFDWKDIGESLTKNIGLLPERHEHQASTDEQDGTLFRKTLCDFTRELILADPGESCNAAGILLENQRELRYVASLIGQRLSDAPAAKHDPIHTVPLTLAWFEKMRRSEVPGDIEEAAADLLNKGDLIQARMMFRLLTESFEGYAEGYNYLGLIALREEKLDEAISYFKKTSELGRRHFPKRMAKSSYWNDHRTRPYMRGLRNLVITLNQQGKYDDALEICTKIETECNDEMAVKAFRASIFLNTKKWQEAYENARYLHHIYPSESFIAAFALLEMNNNTQAAGHFIHAFLNSPRAAKILLGQRVGRKTDLPPKTGTEIDDHNTGVELLEQLGAYLKECSSKKIQFFTELMNQPLVATLLTELGAAIEGWHADRDRKYPEHFSRMMEMKKSDFAFQKATELLVSTGEISAPPLLKRSTSKKSAKFSSHLH